MEKKPQRKDLRQPRKPLRISVTTAGELLDIEDWAVRNLIADGTFTALAPNGRGRGKRLYLLPAEVEAYARGGRPAVDALRQTLAR